MKGIIAKNLRELTAEMKEEKADGAFFCDFYIFSKIYQLEARRILRLGIEEYILLFTVQDKPSPGAAALEDSACEKEADRLGEILQRYLRIGDVVTRCNQTQFLVLLPVCRHESVRIVAQRILNLFDRNVKVKGISVRYELAELLSVKLEGI